MASCKGYRVLERSKKAKKNVVIAGFSKIETRLKALYVRLKGIPEGGKIVGTVFFCHPAFSVKQKAKSVPTIFWKL